MDKLLQTETELIGQWVEKDGGVQADSVARRIDRLVDYRLVAVQAHPRDLCWTQLYRDPVDGRYWEHTYPESVRHGGGPPALRVISESEIAKEYGFNP
ncbi:Imm27 family immunity protein [Erythrobacter crassostreae]|uniref:Uncharacterized protein n=1 Tax=Erythrobacter crassostreae TaxID=2828328 RepID=A0A9X1F3L9_9SPHN|nr:Imm27 family immunity protein [Erythrobacter crassostrea]MBV7259681.1 hypothetical protein [Erythrobacter crassostrea]